LKTILRYIIRSILERRLRTALIISAIMISSAMFFASVSISGTLVNMQMTAFRQSYGYSDIIIRSGEGSPSRFLYTNKAEKYRKDTEYIIGEMTGYGTYIADKTAEPKKEADQSGRSAVKTEKAGTILRGIDITELQKLTPCTFKAEENLYPFKGMKVVISTDTAKKYNLECGSNMFLEINGVKNRFTVCGIIKPTGAHAESGGSFHTILPLTTLNSLYDARGRVDMVYIKLLYPSKLERMLFLLSRDYSRYTVSEPFSEWEIKKQTDRIAAPVVIVTVILSFMCIYIIHTTFKIIVLERLPVIGTFRSIGAGKLATDFILIVESLIYGIIGGITGCCFGTGLLYCIAALPDSSASGMGIKMDITPVQLASTVVIAIMLAVAGSVISIVKTVRVPIKDIIFGMNEKTVTHAIRNAVLGCALICLSFAVPVFVPIKSALAIDTACIVAILLAGSFLIPLIMDCLLQFMQFCCASLPGSVLSLTVRILRQSRTAYSGISMLMIGISSLYMISTLNWSQIRDSSVVFDRNMYDMTMTLPNADKTTLRLITETDGVDGVLGNYYTGPIRIEGVAEPIYHIQGINPAEFPLFQKLKTDNDKGELLVSLDKGRKMMISNMLKSRLNVKTGDSLVLKFSSGNGVLVRRTYEVIGFFDTMIKGKWSYALISENNFRMDIQERFYGPIYIKAGKAKDGIGKVYDADKEDYADNVTSVMNNLKAAFSKRQPDIELKEEARKADRQSNGQLFFMLQGFTVITLITGTFGILNNLIIGFLQKKRRLAMLRSCGMSRNQMRGMIAAEAVIQGVIGSASGILAGLGTTWIIVPRIILALNTESSIYFSPSLTALCFITGIITYVLASAGIMFKASSLDIISAIKLE
jgi:putative ABC transport system permease protein